MKIEVCCGSYRDALAAAQGGADRAELCQSLFFGGLTPSLGTLQMVKANTALQAATMLRPREGGFCYNEDELQLMLQDCALFAQHGADAVVFGCLLPTGFIDYEQTKRLVSKADGKCQTVFHKAFDLCKDDPLEATQRLKEIGVSRILTAGKGTTALEGASVLRQMIAVGGIEILPAGGVRAHNVAELQAKTGCNWVHTSAFEPQQDSTGVHESIRFTGTVPPAQGEYTQTNAQVIANIVAVAAAL